MNKFDRSDLVLERWNYLAGTTGKNRSLLTEEDASSSPSGGSAGGSKLSDQQKDLLKKLTGNAPTNLSGFVSSLKKLATIVEDIDTSGANLGGTQFAQYWTQIMTIIDSMMSEEKTSSAETSKVTKALG